jgi:glutamyl-tRNA reductase
MSEMLWALVMDSSRHDSETRETFREELDESALGPSGVLLRTCQRTELYGFGPVPRGIGEIRPILQEEAARHLIRVAAGLESGVVGEDEVLHQVRQSLAEAHGGKGVDGMVRRLFETAIATGRRARAGRPAMTRGLGERAIAWLADKAELRGRPVLVVGAGTMGAALATSAKRRGADVTVASRTAERAALLAHKLGAASATLEAAAELSLSSAAVAIALAGPWHELTRSPDCPVAEISTPPALDHGVREKLDGRLLDIDRLLAMTPGSHGIEAQAYSRRVEPLVTEAVDGYMDWLRARNMRAPLPTGS